MYFVESFIWVFIDFFSPKKLNTSLNFQTLKLDFYIGRDGALVNEKKCKNYHVTRDSREDWFPGQI